jgi:hypothetical protein
MNTTSAERLAQANAHQEFLALCEAYGTLTDEGRDEALAEIVRYVEGLEHSRYAKRFARFANEDEYESWLSERQGW